jgi:hypothetical protein
VLASLASFAADLGKAVSAERADARSATKILDQIGDLLGQLDPKTHQSLLDHPVVDKFLEIKTAQVAANDDPPGTPYGNGLGAYQKPWEWRHLRRPEDVDPTWRPGQPQPPNTMLWVQFTPQENIVVTWNGLRWNFFADMETYCPKCFVDLYQHRRHESRMADQHKRYMFGQGPPPQDPTIIAAETGKIRASNGTYRGGIGTVGMGNREEGAGEGEPTPAEAVEAGTR